MTVRTQSSNTSFPSKSKNSTKAEKAETEVYECEMNVLHVDELNPNQAHQKFFMDNVLKTLTSRPPRSLSDTPSWPQLIDTYHKAKGRACSFSASTVNDNGYSNITLKR